MPFARLASTQEINTLTWRKENNKLVSRKMTIKVKTAIKNLGKESAPEMKELMYHWIELIH